MPSLAMRRMLPALAAALVAAGCASAPPRPSDEFVWPLPPDPPRVKYVRTIRTASDLGGSWWSRLRRSVVGSDRDLSVFNPTAVALSPDEKLLYVACTSTGRVLEMDLVRGAIRLAASVEGRRPKVPLGLATDAQGNLYVADSGDHVVWVYAPGGSFLREVGRAKLSRPVALAIDRKRQLLYVAEGGRTNDDSHLIEVFSLDGRHLRTIGKRGAAAGEFNFPTYLAVSRDGTLFVADTLNFRIQLFDPEGTLVGVFGSQSTQVGGFNKSKGLAFDAAGNLHVADAANSSVQMFNAKQQLLMAYGGFGGRDELMQTPNGIAIDSKNNIYIADLVLDRVNQYVLVDTSNAEGVGPRVPASVPPAAPRK